MANVGFDWLLSIGPRPPITAICESSRLGILVQRAAQLPNPTLACPAATVASRATTASAGSEPRFGSEKTATGDCFRAN